MFTAFVTLAVIVAVVIAAILFLAGTEEEHKADIAAHETEINQDRGCE